MKGSVTLIVTLLCIFAPLFVLKVEGATSVDADVDINSDADFDAFSPNVWDFIIVGSGASGSVVAARLANETNKRILLLEGGNEHTGQRDIGGTDYVAAQFVTNPATGKKTLGTPLTRYDVPTMADSIRIDTDILDNMWNISAQGPFYLQARVVGGNMATNGLAWIVPCKSDFDEWGIPGYTSNIMWPYMKKIENASETGYGSTVNRGKKGPINIKFASFVQLEQYRFVNACNTAGYPTGGDMNQGTVEQKVYLCQNNIKTGVRQSTSIAYLAPVLGRCSNLDFRTGAIVTRVLFGCNNRAVGVEYQDVTTGTLKRVYARKEVVLATGALLTPKILYNSGIGPLSILKAFGKPLRVVNEIIGQKIRNQQRAAMRYTDPTIINANFYNYPAASMQYAESGTGIIEGKGLWILNFQSDFPPGPYPDLSALGGPAAGATPGNVYTQSFGVTVTLNRNVYANGTVNLTSSDPLAPINFNANVFAVQSDAERVAQGILKMRNTIMIHWNGSATETSPGPSYDTVPKLVTWLRTNGLTPCHYASSCPMGLDAKSPCDPDMHVRGVTALRLVGPAVIPGPVYPGMMPLAVALGEKGTDLIKLQFGL